MRIEEYEKMYHLENYYWWFQGRIRIIFNLLKKFNVLEGGDKIVLDAGCGTGLILDALIGKCKPFGIDFSKKALGYCKQRGLENLVLGDVANLPFKDGSCDVAMGLDLVEHIENDGALMEEYYRVLKSSGTLIMTVPAHPFLWSEHDEALSHYRRYSYSSFRALIEKHGFKPIKLSYAITFTYFPIIIFRKLQPFFKKSSSPRTHLIKLPKIINAALIGLLRIEAFLLKFVNFPVGVSLVCIAKKQ